jgi:hypothetical protein
MEDNGIFHGRFPFPMDDNGIFVQAALLRTQTIVENP